MTTYNRCCRDCVNSFSEAGTLDSAHTRANNIAKPHEECQSCSGLLIDGEIYRATVTL